MLCTAWLAMPHDLLDKWRGDALGHEGVFVRKKFICGSQSKTILGSSAGGHHHLKAEIGTLVSKLPILHTEASLLIAGMFLLPEIGPFPWTVCTKTCGVRGKDWFG